MKIKILDFIHDSKNNRVGFADFHVTYDEQTWEIFRQVNYYEKEDKKWLSLGFCKRDEKWLDRYERSKPLKPVLNLALEELKVWFKDNGENNQIEDYID